MSCLTVEPDALRCCVARFEVLASLPKSVATDILLLSPQSPQHSRENEANEKTTRVDHSIHSTHRAVVIPTPAMSSTAKLGRFMFAFLFLASAVNKLVGLAEGGEMLDTVAPRLSVARTALYKKIGIDPLFFVSDALLVLIATVMELSGSILFMADFSLGAKLLLLFTLLVTPIMHPFWLLGDTSESAGKAVDLIMFFKNASLCGALLVYLDMKPSLEAARVIKKRQ